MTGETPGTLAELFETAYRQFAHLRAAKDARGAHTFAELGTLARNVACNLYEWGLRRGDRVAMIVGNRVEYAVIEQALAIGGFVRVSLNTRLHSQEMASILADAEPAFTFVDLRWLADAGPEGRRLIPGAIAIVGGSTAVTPSIGWEDLRYEQFASAPPAPTSWDRPGPEDVSCFMYTSGTGGLPKAVVHTQRSSALTILNTAQVLREAGARAREVAVHTAPLSHFSGVVALTVFVLGGQNVYLSRFDPEELMASASANSATMLPMVPTQLNMVTEYLDQSPQDLTRIRVVPYAGSAIAPERLAAALRHFPQALVQLYGSSEAPMPITALLPADHAAVVSNLGLPRYSSAGRARPEVELSLRSHDNGPVETGEPGEIVVRSASNTTRYWKNPAATAEIIDADGFLHTGDIGRLDAEGFLYIVDRKKDMIISGGFNVFPREVETAISSLAGIRDVAVVGAPDNKWGEAIVAVAVPRPGAELTLEAIQKHCRTQLAGYKIPRLLVVVEALPRGSTGKLQKTVLKQMFWGDRERKIGG